jgi:NADPH:quinone reductase-like Zn-dependent oxidoreductase
MQAYLVSKYKRPMQVGEVAEPAIDDRDVLVDVHAAGVNLLDAKIRDGGSSSCSSPTRRHSSSGTTSPASSPASGRP